MSPRHKPPNDDPRQGKLLDLPEQKEIERLVARLRHPIWTENKAKLIERYLLLFVQVTYSGTYIDGFAGPQEPEKQEMWAANLALNVHLLKHFHLFEKNRKKITMLRKLRNDQPLIDHWGRKMNRTVEIYAGDFNKNISKLLNSRSIVDAEPVFCLLDQRMFECHWSTVRALARYKSVGYNKFEQFYFFAIGWLKRSIFGVKKNLNKIEDWWGREDWKTLKTQSREDIFKEMLNRFKNELGYKHVQPFPIFERQNGGNIMYYMIHCADHDEAPKLMLRAYNTALRRRGSQLPMFPENDGKTKK